METVAGIRPFDFEMWVLIERKRLRLVQLILREEKIGFFFQLDVIYRAS